VLGVNGRRGCWEIFYHFCLRCCTITLYGVGHHRKSYIVIEFSATSCWIRWLRCSGLGGEIGVTSDDFWVVASDPSFRGRIIFVWDCSTDHTSQTEYLLSVSLTIVFASRKIL
jgi:hypothetical protein